MIFGKLRVGCLGTEPSFIHFLVGSKYGQTVARPHSACFFIKLNGTILRIERKKAAEGLEISDVRFSVGFRLHARG